jgi:hypothetical protein
MRLEEGLEAGGLEVLVVGEDVGEAKAAHDGEGNTVNNAGVARAAAFVFLPALPPVVFGRNEEAFVGNQIATQSDYILAGGPSRDRIGAL